MIKEQQAVRSNLRGGIVSMWLLATVVVAVAAAAGLFLAKAKGVDLLSALQKGTTQSVPSVQNVSSSDEAGDIQNELESTDFEGIDRDLEDTSKDLDSF